MLQAIVNWKNYFIFLLTFYVLSEVNKFVGQHLLDMGVTDVIGQTASFGLSITVVYVTLIVTVYTLNLIKSQINKH